MMTKMNFRKVLAMVMGIIMCCSFLGMNITSYAADANGTVSELTDPVWGDTNCDGTPCELADVILIMQYYCCPDRYGLGKEEGVTEQGMLNADVYRNGDGLTLMDALMIQKYMLGIITELPYSYLNPSPVTTETTSTTTTTTTTSTTTTTTTTSTTTTTTTSKPTTTSTTSTTTTTTTSKPTTTSTTSTTTTTTTSKPTTTSTTSTTTTTTTSKPTTTSTTSTTTTTTTSKPTTTSTTSTTTTTTTSKPTTTSTTSTTTTTTTSKPTTTSTTSTTTTTTTSKPTTTSTTSTTTTTTTSKPTTTSTTSTTTTSTTSSTTTTSTTSISTSEISTVSYYYETYVEDDGTVYYLNEDGEMLGPDSDEDVYEGLIKTAEKYGFKNYKIVYSETIIPYAYAIAEHDGISGCEAWQLAPINDLQFICPETYAEYVDQNQLVFYNYVIWRPKDKLNCYYSCGNDHFQILKTSYIRSNLGSLWMLIPTDENGNDILKLASDSSYSSASLHTSMDN